MRHNSNKVKLHRSSGHRKALMRNLATSLILADKIETTEPKAKALRPIIERLISYTLKDEPRGAIRKLQSYLFDEAACLKIMEVLKPRYVNRKSGFVRIRAIGYRKGDASKVCRIELIA